MAEPVKIVKISFFTSRKTTWAGIASILSGLALALEAFSNSEGGLAIDKLTIAVGLIASGLSGLFARDNKVTSKMAGAE